MLTCSCSSLSILFLFMLNASSRMSAAAFSSSTTAAAQQQCTKKAALVFLHGLGDTPAGWTSIQQQLPTLQPSLASSNVEYVFPAAPDVAITINGGARMPGWSDVLDWPISIQARDDEAGMLQSVSQLEEHVDELVARGIPKSRIVLGGFSQGGAVALLTTYRSSERFAGCVSLSGWLALGKDLSVSDDAKQTPLFWGHGEYDDKVLFEQQAHGVKTLKKKGVETITDKSYDIGHSSDPDELHDMAAFLNSVLFEEQGSA